MKPFEHTDTMVSVCSNPCRDATTGRYLPQKYHTILLNKQTLRQCRNPVVLSKRERQQKICPTFNLGQG